MLTQNRKNIKVQFKFRTPQLINLQFAGEKVRIVAPVVKEKGEGFENGKMLTTLFTSPAVTI